VSIPVKDTPREAREASRRDSRVALPEVERLQQASTMRQRSRKVERGNPKEERHRQASNNSEQITTAARDKNPEPLLFLCCRASVSDASQIQELLLRRLAQTPYKFPVAHVRSITYSSSAKPLW
jgi:hypothetical protein